MRTVFLILFLPLLAQATERLPEPGVYPYAGSFTVLQKRRAEAVYAFTEEGRARLEELKKQGQTCEHIQRMIFRCVAFVSPQGTEGEIRSRVEEILSGAVLEFGPLVSAPEKVTEGSSYVEWKVGQPVKFLGRSYPGFRYSILDGKLHKFGFGDPVESGVIAESDGGFSYVDTIRVQESREVIISYFIQAGFRR